MACRLKSHFCSLRHGLRFLSSANHRAGRQMRSTAQADASQGKTKFSCQKTQRLAFYCVIPKAQCGCPFARDSGGIGLQSSFDTKRPSSAIEFDRQRLAVAVRKSRERKRNARAANPNRKRLSRLDAQSISANMQVGVSC
jgi:hypothetical protein